MEKYSLEIKTLEDYEVVVKSRKPLNRGLRELIVAFTGKLEEHNKVTAIEIIEDALRTAFLPT